MIGVLRDKFKWQPYRLHWVRQELHKLANLVLPQRSLSVTEDPEDNRVLECAVEAGSDCIITRDKDLLRLERFEEIPILTSAQFLESLNG
jgi:putative PIN family toxin of toxin-antitoxin system